MPSRKELTRNNVRAGIFVTFSLLLIAGVVITLSGSLRSLLRSYASYTVTFPVSDGVANLQSGSVVRIGGVSLGAVTDVQPRLEQDLPFETVEVQFEVESRVGLYEDAQVLVKSPFIGAESWLEVTSVGTAGKPRATELTGFVAPGLLSTLLGPESANHAGEILADTKEFTSFLGRVPEDYGEHVEPALEDFRETARSARSMADDVRDERWLRWATSIDQVMDWTESATASIDEAVETGRLLLNDGREMVADNRPQVDSIVDNVDGASADIRDFSARLNDETIAKVDRLLVRGRDALAEAEAVMTTFRKDYAAWSAGFDDTMANTNLASQQLKLATGSPWKLLYRPTTDELEHELLYEAARSFAMAASDLKAASESVSRVLEEHGDRVAADDTVYTRLRDNLEQSFDNYHRAQQQLFDVLVTDLD
jgi:ABC-type transporter Mla subunit MlaD